MLVKRANHPPLAWAKFIQKIRHVLDSKGFTEVSTPSLVPVGAFEHALDCLEVRFAEGTCELHTSPEMEMKKLLSQHAIPIYQIAKCFRDDPDTGIHFKEFHMLEFYRVRENYRAIIKDCQVLLNTVAGRALTYEELSIEDAVFKSAGIRLSECPDTETLRSAIHKNLGIQESGDFHWEDLFFKLMLDYVEPALNRENPTILTGFPLSVSTLSEKSTSGFGERFEIYWKGMEICNGATELTDAEELKKRYQLEKELREANGKEAHRFPEEFYQTLKKLPPCAGVAVGLDRLFWCTQPAPGN